MCDGSVRRVLVIIFASTSLNIAISFQLGTIHSQDDVSLKQCLSSDAAICYSLVLFWEHNLFFFHCSVICSSNDSNSLFVIGCIV